MIADHWQDIDQIRMHHEFFARILSARKAFEQDPEGSLNFALRSVEAGMDLEKQVGLRHNILIKKNKPEHVEIAKKKQKET